MVFVTLFGIHAGPEILRRKGRSGGGGAFFFPIVLIDLLHLERIHRYPRLK